MSELVIREAAEADFRRIREIATAAWKPVYELRRERMGAEMFAAIYGEGHVRKGRDVEAWCRQHPELTRVAEQDGQVVGFVTWALDTPAPGCGEILNNAVAPEAQGRGVAKAMYRWALDLFRSAGMKYANVRTGLDPAHAPARAAYKAVGYHVGIESISLFRKL